MKNIIKEIVIHLIVGLVIFSAFFLLFNHHTNQGKSEDFSEMSNSTFPIMQIISEQRNYNTMSAYVDPVDLSLVRNQITLINKDNTLDICLHNYDYDITAIQYTLFTKSEDDPLEEGTLNQLEDQEEEGIRTGKISFETNIEAGKSYYLKMAVRLDKDTRVYFYTKLQNGENNHLAECMNYVNTFHNNLFDATAFQENVRYLEPSDDITTISLESLDIHSSTTSISFGNMTVKEESEPRITIKETNEVYSVIQLDTILSSEIKDGVIQYYDLCENYKVRYTSDRMYLLDYNRTMDAYYNKSLYDPSQNYVTLGIQNAENVHYMSSDKGYKVCFSQEGQLWYYNYNSSDAAKVYSFSSENLADLRNDQNNHDIKILRMDDDGNIVYVVYGYMNRGHYEGKNGIQLLRYNAAEKYNEELAFLSTSVPFDRMKDDVEKLVYLSEENVFYCLLDGDLHSVDLNSKEDTIMESGMIHENITASKNQNIIAIEESQDLTSNTSIHMIDLESGKEQTFTCDADKRIRAIGFLADDFIYGIADASDVKMSSGDVLTFPIKKLSIVNMDGEEVKTYHKSGRYITKTQIDGQVLEMQFSKKSGNKFVSTNDTDYIRYKEAEESSSVSLVYDYSYTYWNQLFISFPSYVYIQVEPDLVLTKVLAGEDNRVIELARTRSAKVQYYVYAEGKEQGVYDTLTEAVLSADELRGSVISSDEKLLWECGFEDFAMVAGMDQVTKVKSDAKSLAGCLEMIAKVNGTQVKAADITTKDQKVLDLVANYSGHTAYNLTGCSVDEVLYYVSEGYPILTKYSKNRYVILMSYNSGKLRYLDPVKGESIAVDRTSLTDKIEKAGNVFYTYVAE